jgi:putative DNA primase/helicase
MKKGLEKVSGLQIDLDDEAKKVEPPTASFDHVPESIGWAWKDWLPKGAVTVLAGYPGSGKSALALRIAASFLDARPWPDDKPSDRTPGKILWAETSRSLAIHKRRAVAWSLPLDRIMLPFDDPLKTASINSAGLLDRIEAAAAMPEVGLIVIDSLDIEPKDKEYDWRVSKVFDKLERIAAKTQTAFLVLHRLDHVSQKDAGTVVSLSKLSKRSRFLRDLPFVMAIDAPDPKDPARFRIRMLKNSLGPLPSALGMTIADEGVTFCEPPSEPLDPKEATRLERARDFLLDVLEGGPQPVSQVEGEATRCRISPRTVMRAKRSLGVKSSKRSDCWFWSLPANHPPYNLFDLDQKESEQEG